MVTEQMTINNVNVSVNTQDILPMVLRMNDERDLALDNGYAPNLRDGAYANYSDAAKYDVFNNPMSAYNKCGLDNNFIARGAFKIAQCYILHTTSAGAVDTSLISTNLADTWKISIQIVSTEPLGLCLSPWTNKNEEDVGMMGVNNISAVFNLDSTCSRVFKYTKGFYNRSCEFALTSATNPDIVVSQIENYGKSNYISTVTGGWTGDAANGNLALNVLTNAKLLFCFKSLTSIQAAKVSSRNVCPMRIYDRYISQISTTPAIIQNGTAQITSNSIQLNQVNDLIMIVVRRPMSSNDNTTSDGLMVINSISVTYNNTAGLLSTLTQPQLYELSRKNGSNQSFQEFSGFANVGSYNYSSAVAGTAAVGYSDDGGYNNLATGGSLLVINPAKDLNLPVYLSNGSLGQFQLQFTVNVTNQYADPIVPEVVIYTMNSGLWVCQNGSAQVYTGILTKEAVLSSKEGKAVPKIAAHEFDRLVGGRLIDNKGHAGVKRILGMLKDKKNEVMGAGISGGVMSGGAGSGGVLGRHLRHH
jgi:hypothetical protein